MKTNRISLFAGAFVLALASACSQEDLTEDEYAQADDVALKSVLAETSISDIPDIVVDDSVLIDHALVSQNREDYITYSYDRYARLSAVNYYRRNTIDVTNTTLAVSRIAYMQDRFVYSNAGRLTQLARYVRSSPTPRPTSVAVVKNYTYRRDGKLSVITTRWFNTSAVREKVEYLEYDMMGNMVKRTVKGPGTLPLYFKYVYDRSGRLTKITGYRDPATIPYFICDLFYDNRNNIERKEFYYPLPVATSVNDVYRKWVVKYRYDSYFNPFRDINLPVSSLFEWMDPISPSNITAIKFANDVSGSAIFYRYRYNNLGYPVLRMRSFPDPSVDVAE